MLTEVGGVAGASPSSHRQTQAARALGGQLQPAGGDETETGGLGHDGGQTRMTKPFLETSKERGFVSGFDIDHSVWPQTGLPQGRGEQVRAGHAPENLTRTPGCDPGREQGCGRAVHGLLTSAGDLVKGAERQAAAGQVSVEVADPEREDARGASAPLLKGAYSIAQTF